MFLFSGWILVLDLAVLSFGLAVFKWRKRLFFAHYRPPYPPGPPARSWILGSFGDLSVENQWDRFTEWSNQYGDIIHFRTLNEHFIVVSNYDAAIEIFEKRSNNYSSRQFTTMAELMGWNFLTGLKPYGQMWRTERRIFQQAFKPDASLTYHETQTHHINLMLQKLLNNPEDFRDHIRNTAGAIIMSAVYDYDVSSKDDAYVKIAETSLERLGVAIFPGGSFVNIFPFLRHLPAWLPGCGFQQFASDTKAMTDRMLNEPLAGVEKRAAKGSHRPCLASELLAEHGSPAEYTAVKNVCGTSYAAGADTTVSSTATFFCAMTNSYDVQLKAQTEIENVIGNDRLATLEDRPSLPYIEAIYREVLRWQPVLPFCLFHVASDEDIYQGYYIPKGATVIPNIQAMTRDPNRYINPENFDPSRFLQKDGTLNEDDVEYVFGFGRRICPGRHFASATVWLSIVRILSIFDIRKQKDESGNEIPVDGEYNTGLMVHPLPFKCSITPRSENAERLLLETIADGL